MGTASKATKVYLCSTISKDDGAGDDVCNSIWLTSAAYSLS